MSGLKNTFSWSKSRDEIFSECKRKYYYHYYGSWGGWEKDAPSDTREIYILKNLKNRFTWKGEVVHKVVARVLNSVEIGTPIPLGRALWMARGEMVQDYRDSELGSYAQQPKRKCGLFEHAYGQPFSIEHRDILISEAQTCVENFFELEIFAKAKQMGLEKWLFIDPKYITPGSRIESFELEGTTVYASPDFVFLNENGELELVDWKSGEKTSHAMSTQLVCYVLYAMSKWSVPLDKVLVTECSLQHNQIFSHTPNKEEMAKGKQEIADSIDKMRTLLRDAKNNVAEIKDLPPVGDPGVCKWCNFQRVCPEAAI